LRRISKPDKNTGWGEPPEKLGRGKGGTLLAVVRRVQGFDREESELEEREAGKIEKT